jgi:DNA-binding CsgD family transcriptional regulator
MASHDPSESDLDSLQKLGISRRQSEVLFWLHHGKSRDEIAIILGIQPETVHTHTKRLYEKLGVGKRTVVAIMAERALANAA